MSAAMVPAQSASRVSQLTGTVFLGQHVGNLTDLGPVESAKC